MKITRISPPMRLFLAVSATVQWLGLGFTGLGNVHWLLYVVPTFFTFAVITRICPGYIIATALFGKR